MAWPGNEEDAAAVVAATVGVRGRERGRKERERAGGRADGSNWMHIGQARSSSRAQERETQVN
jgi:hypothetical protein